MKRHWKWWVGLLILAIALVIGWEEKRCQTQAYECRASYAAQAQSERLAGNISVNQQASQQQAIAAACEPNGYFCRLLGAANLPTVLLVFVGIGGVWAALKTLKSIDRQTVATKEAAKAALLNAQAVINSERAWIHGEILQSWIGSNRWTLQVKNHGKTPAQILGYEIAPGLFEGVEFSKKGLAAPVTHPIRVFVPSGEPKALGNDFDMNDWVTGESSAIANADGLGLSVTIKYRDVVTEGKEQQGGIHETSFLYSYSFSSFALTRKTEYDEYT